MRTVILILILLALSAGGCVKFVSDAEISPNKLLDAPPEQLLSASEVAIFAAYSGDIARTTTMMMQTQAGIDRQTIGEDKYYFPELTAVFCWYNVYAGALINLKVIIKKTENTDKRYYAGIARLLGVMGIGLITDVWGDIPYTEAGLGEENLAPHYETQEVIYQKMQAEIDLALQELNDSASLAFADGIQTDLIYQGDLQKWRILAYMLKARYANHLSQVDPQGSAQSALAALDSAYALGLSDKSNDANGYFGTSPTNQNLWSQMYEQWGFLCMGKRLTDLMIAQNDPRLALYATTDANDAYSGYPAGGDDVTDPWGCSFIGELYASANSLAPLVTLAEMKFIEAEAALRLGDNLRASSAFNQALEVSIDYPAIADEDKTAFLEAQSVNSDITLEKIMTQKYVSLFTQAETWTDWRRTAYPVLEPANGNYNNNKIPVRLTTIGAERINNPNAIIVSDINEKLWWDKD